MNKKQKSYPARATNQAATTNQNEVVATQPIVRHQMYQHSGPLPDPASLDRYNQIVPDAAERIIKMAELNADHLRKMEMLAINAEIEDNRARHREAETGQYAGILSVFVAFATAAYALYLGHTGVAGTICSVTVGGLVAVFVTGRKSHAEKTENQSKEEKPNA